MASPRRPSPAEILLFVEATLALSAASLAVRWLPFRAIVRSLGGGRVQPAATAAQPEAIATAVQRASRRLPWRSVCLQQGLAAHWMLRRRGAASRLHYGLRSDAERLSAHVWVTAGGVKVIGEEEVEPHIPVASFPPEELDG